MPAVSGQLADHLLPGSGDLMRGRNEASVWI